MGARVSCPTGARKRSSAQGDPADAVFYLQKGRVKLTVVSKQGKEAVVGLVSPDMFFGEGCLAGQHCACRLPRRPKTQPSCVSKKRT